jgi:hypothetical protein
MARIFYWEATGLIYGTHPDGNIPVPGLVAWIEVPEQPDQIAWPGGSERSACVKDGALAMRDGWIAIRDAEADLAFDNKDLKALVLLILDEFNILRALHGLAARTEAQLRTAFKNKRATL